MNSAPGDGEHDYRNCMDEACADEGCVAWRAGRDAGRRRGYDAGFMKGAADGFARGQGAALGPDGDSADDSS